MNECAVCRIALLSIGWFKSQGKRNRRYFIDLCINFLKLKQEVIEKAAYKVKYFNNDYEYAFFLVNCLKIYIF